MESVQRRVILIYWKERKDNPFEVFSSLKKFCISYPSYNYNTLSNYLSKQKIAYSDQTVHIERKPIITEAIKKRKIVPVVQKGLIKDFNEEQDIAYWLSRPPIERVAAVTELVQATLKKGERMNKSIVHKRKLHQ